MEPDVQQLMTDNQCVLMALVLLLNLMVFKISFISC